MNKAEYDSKISELAGKPVTMDNIFIGLIFRCSWWEMADYYEVVGKTAKSLKLREIKWETCSAEDAGQKPDGDPTYRWTRIVRDKEGNPVPERNQFTKEEIIKTVRIKVSEKDGHIWFKSPNYDGAASVSVCTLDYMHMYWD